MILVIVTLFAVRHLQNPFWVSSAPETMCQSRQIGKTARWRELRTLDCPCLLQLKMFF
jgi:hypothetical protein